MRVELLPELEPEHYTQLPGIKNRPESPNNDSRAPIRRDFRTCLTLRQSCNELSFLWRSPLSVCGVEDTQQNCVRGFLLTTSSGPGSGVWVVFTGLWSVPAPCWSPTGEWAWRESDRRWRLVRPVGNRHRSMRAAAANDCGAVAVQAGGDHGWTCTTVGSVSP